MARDSAKKSSPAKSALTKRYGSIAEIKQEFFPNAAAEEEAESKTRWGDETYEDLMTELFGDGVEAHA